MSPQAASAARTPFVKLLRGTMIFLAALVVFRFLLEILGTPEASARYVSSTAGLFLVAVYLAAVAPMRGGMQKFRQLLFPAILLSVWMEAWVILMTLVSAVLRLSRSHFAEEADYGNWGHLGRHILGHILEIGVFFVVLFVLMAIVHLFWRWPITVGPGAILGALVIVRFWVEAMGVETWRASAWSSTVAILLCGFFLGGVGPRLGLGEARKLLAPALVLGWGWRLWVFIATLLSALLPFYKTHYFDASQGDVAGRLLRFLGASVVEGFVAGLIVWGIAVWISRSIRRPAET